MTPGPAPAPRNGRSAPSMARRARRLSTPIAPLALAALLAANPGCAFLGEALEPLQARPYPGLVGAPEALGEGEVERRLEFVNARLDANRRHAAAWQYGWLVVNVGGTAASSAFAAIDEGNEQVFDILEAAKGTVGSIRLLVDPMPGMSGADPIRAMPSRTAADKLAQLARAERLLWDEAQRARQRTGWFVHVGNVVFNLASGAVLLALDEPVLAAVAFGVDTVVGEAQILTAPWRPIDDWEEYERFVATGLGAGPSPPTRWHVRPNGRGVVIAVEF